MELFVLDDGWFGARNSDTAGLGDYDVNLRKLPGGLGEFADSIEKLGMKFGLWFEPESVNVDSELYRAHPDWAIKPPVGEPCFGRNQLLLVFAGAVQSGRVCPPIYHRALRGAQPRIHAAQAYSF